jgi:hypothetical protein
MPDWIFVVLIISLPFVIYGVMLVFVHFYRDKCACCGKRTLKTVEFIKATVIIDGQRAPDSWGYYLCENCGARYKKHHRGTWEDVTQSEWELYVEKKVVRPSMRKR